MVHCVEIYFCLLENLCAYSDPNFSMLTHRCKFTVFYFDVMFTRVHISEYKFNNIEDVNTVF